MIQWKSPSSVVISVIVTMLHLHSLCAQNPDKIILDRLYMGSFPSVLKNVEMEHHIQFKYDANQLNEIHIDSRPIKVPLSEELSNWCREAKMKWYQGKDSIIYIIDRNSTPQQEILNRTTVKQYEGNASRHNFNLTAKIIDKESSESLPFATVLVKGTNIGASSNSDGIFTLKGIPSDTATLLISYVGYVQKKVFLNPSYPAEGALIEMQPIQTQLAEVIIQGEQEEVLRINEQISTIQMTPKKLEYLPNIGEKDILRSLQLMPGVSGANEGSSGLYVRGGTPDQNLILYDGFTIYHVDHLYGFFSAFNANALKDVQLYKGGFESRFGGRLSSVTEITGKDGDAQKFNAGADISLLSMNAFIEMPLGKKVTTLIAFRRSYKGPLYNKIFKQYNNSSTATQTPKGPGGMGGFQSTVSSYFYDLNTKVSYHPTEKDIVSLSVFNGTDKLDNGSDLSNSSSGFGGGPSFNFNVTDLTRYGNFGSSLRWGRKWNKAFYGATALSFSNYYSQRDRSNEGTRPNSDGEDETFKMGTLENNDLKDISFRSDYTYDITQVHQLGFGAFATHYDIAYTYSQNDTSTILDRHDKGDLTGVYLQDKIKLLKGKLQVIPGLRYSYYNLTNKTYSEPRLSASYLITKRIKLSAAYGHYYQFANRVTREDILSGSRDFWILSDGDNIPVSSSQHYITGASYENKNYLFSIEAYHKKLWNISEYSLRFNANMQGVSYDENFYTGQGYARGIEFLAQKKLGKFSGWTSYTLAEAKNQFDIYGKSYFNANQNVTHEGKIALIYKYRNWNFSSTWVYATGRPYTAPEGGYTLTLLDGTEQDFITAGSKNSRQLAAYHRLDFSVGYHFKTADGEKDRGALSFSLFNVYNRKNVWYKEYQVVDGTVVENNRTFLGITPNLSLTLRLH